EDAIMLPRDDGDAARIVILCILLTALTAVLLTVASLFSEGVAALLGVDAIAPWLWLLAPTLLLMRVVKLGELWVTREREFRHSSGAELVNKVVMVSSRVGSGLWTTLGAGGLIGGFTAGQVAGAAYYAAVLGRRASAFLGTHRPLDGLRDQARRYERFPLYAMPASLLNAVVARLPVLLLPLFFSLETLGLFGRAFVALAVPLGLVGNAVSQVFFVHAVDAHREGRLGELTRLVHDRLVMLGVFPALMLVFLGPELFEFVFGRAWRAAGVFEQWLAVWFFSAAVASPLTRLFDVLERQRLELVMSFVAFVVLGAALVAGGRMGDDVLVMALIGIAGTSVRILHIGVMMRLAGVSVRAALRPYVRYGALSLPFILPIFWIRTILPLWAIAVIAAFLGGMYFAVVLWRNRLLAIRPSDG